MKISENWENFVISILINLCLPLTPLFFEFVANGGLRNGGYIGERSLAITASTYAFAVSFSTKQKLVFVICLLAGVIVGGVIGFNKTESHAEWVSLNCVVIILVFIINTAERYQRHVKDAEKFFVFF